MKATTNVNDCDYGLMNFVHHEVEKDRTRNRRKNSKREKVVNSKWN